MGCQWYLLQKQLAFTSEFNSDCVQRWGVCWKSLLTPSLITSWNKWHGFSASRCQEYVLSLTWSHTLALPLRFCRSSHPKMLFQPHLWQKSLEWPNYGVNFHINPSWIAMGLWGCHADLQSRKRSVSQAHSCAGTDSDADTKYILQHQKIISTCCRRRIWQALPSPNLAWPRRFCREHIWCRSHF